MQLRNDIRPSLEEGYIKEIRVRRELVVGISGKETVVGGFHTGQ